MMARGTNKENTKVRVIAIYRELMKGRKITAPQIVRLLKNRYGIIADRKTIYHDIAAIDRFVPIKGIPGKNGGYIVWDVLGEAKNG